MSHIDTGYEILRHVLFRAGELDVGKGSDFEDAAKRYILLAYWDIVGSFPWLWAMRYPPLSVITTASIDVVATVTKGSVTVTLASDPGSVGGRKLCLNNDDIPIRIVSNAGAVLTLAAGYPGDSGSSLDGIIFQDEYVLATDILLPTVLKPLGSNTDITIISKNEINGRFPKPTSGDIRTITRKYAAFITDSVIRLQPWPEDLTLLEFEYVQRPSELDFSDNAATDTPIMPVDIRWTIADVGLSYLLDDMGDDRADKVVVKAYARLTEERGRQTTKIKPRLWLPKGSRLGGL